MGWNLIDLIKASGGAGTANQAFSGNVNSAGAGVGMLDYTITGWSFESSTEPVIPGDQTYFDGHSFALAADIIGGSLNHTIRSNGTNKVGVTWSTVDGYVPTVTYNNVTNAAAGPVEVTVQVSAPYATDGLTITKGGWYRDWSYPSTPHFDDGEEVIRIEAGVTSNPSQADATVGFTVTYVPDIGPFNATLTKSYSFTMRKRAMTVNDFDFEWYSDSGYSTRVSQTRFHEFNSWPYDSTTFYLRYKRKAESTWTNSGSYTFNDTGRPET